MKTKKPTHNSVVTKHNTLIEKMAKFHLSELRLIAYCLAHYDSRKPENCSFIAKVEDLRQIFPSMGEKTAYDVIRKTMLELSKKPIEFKKDNEKFFWHWFSGFSYKEGEGQFTFQINPNIQPYLLGLKEHFNKYRLAFVYQFSSASTWKLYENLNRWKNTGAWYVELDELRISLGVEGKYPRFNSLRERLIETSLKEINQKSNLAVHYEKKTNHKTVVALKFFIDEKQGEEVINIENPKVRLLKLLLICGISHTASNNCVTKICRAGKEEHFVKKIPQIKKRWNSDKGVLPKYMLGAINRELEELEQSTPQEQPQKPDYLVSLDCWNAKRQKGETCKVRSRGTAGNRKKCKICLEKLKIEDFGV
ncbi:MAG: RepB family plasmid replication initiator protein [Candidatus Electrothrix sp. GM3_4]|nr:RepB family plasmid replication initiator protein [Candidatus Electrothrix sp. GM3_4]